MRCSGLRTAATISVGVLFLSACSGGTQTTSVGLPFSPVQSARPNNLQHVVYVADNSGSSFVNVLKYGTWQSLATITNGVSVPEGIWVDKNQSLYVTNISTKNVTEYNSARGLVFTYSSGLTGPVGVTTDGAGNAYVADFPSGSVVEFTQANNSPVKTCLLGASPFGVAVDTHGDVFASLPNSNVIVEYSRGLKPSHCNASVLPIQFSSPYGIAFDKHNNLVVCEANASAVDIVAPPYTSITGTLGSGYAGPMAVSINSASDLAYITDTSQHVVDVVRYPGGSNAATLFADSDPTSAVDSKNFVP